MKRSPIGVVRAILCVCVALASFALLARTTYVWNPNGSGGWQSSSQYVDAGGATPTAHDVVQVPENVTVEVSTDADAAFVNTLDGVELTAASSTFVFNQPSDIQWQCAVFGQGAIIKRTAATVEFLPNTQTDINAKFDNGYSAYCALGGMTIENGTLKLPQSGSGGTYSFGPVTVDENATMVLIPDNRTQLAALNGYGTVTNTASTGNGYELQIGYVAYADQTVSHFYGKLMGGIKWYSTGTVYLHGTNSLFAGWTFMHWGRYSEGDAKHGHLYLTKFGRVGGESSIGANYRAAIESRIGGAFHYLGTGEDTNKSFSWSPYATAVRSIMDAGATGGVTFSGSWSQGGNIMACLSLAGSNTVPCVVTGKVSTPDAVTTYITKEGSGTWRFANDANEQKGAMAIKDGTFQFTSIAETNVPCALGLSTILHQPYIGSRDDSKAVAYAFLLGGSGTFPTFEYMGGEPSTCSTRPLALTGTGGKLVSSGAGSELCFSDISSFDAGEKTLALGGDSTEYNMVSNITSGSGSVAVTKEDSGRWIVAGANTLSGKLEVNEGTLELWDRYVGESYPYYRLVIKNTRAGGNGFSYVPEFALYDANGVNRAASLRVHEPDGINASSTVEYQPISISDLAPGEVFFHSANGNKVYHYASYNHEGLDNLFDGTTSKWRMCGTPYNGGQPNGTAGRYMYVVMRLPADTPPILRYDINVGTSSSAASLIGVEASNDGSTWIDLTGDVSTPQSDDWFSGDAFVAGHPLRPGAGLALNVSAAPDANGEAMLDNVTSVQVAAGATLVAKGVRKTISGLTVDCSAGVGTLSGIDFAASGTINLVNVPAGVTDFTVPADFGGVSAESLSNLNAYSMTVDGKRSSRWRVAVAADGIRAALRGICINLR